MNKTNANRSIKNESNLENADVIIFGLKCLLDYKRDLENLIPDQTPKEAMKTKKLIKAMDDYFDDSMKYHAETTQAVRKKIELILGKKK